MVAIRVRVGPRNRRIASSCGQSGRTDQSIPRPHPGPVPPLAVPALRSGRPVKPPHPPPDPSKGGPQRRPPQVLRPHLGHHHLPGAVPVRPRPRLHRLLPPLDPPPPQVLSPPGHGPAFPGAVLPPPTRLHDPRPHPTVAARLLAAA